MADNIKKSISDYIRGFLSSDFVRSASRLMHVNGVSKKIYFWLFAPKSGIVAYEIEGTKARFYTQSYVEFIYLTQTVFATGDEHQVIKTLLQNIKPGDVVYDIGAFVGLHTIFFAKRLGGLGRVVSFEPSAFGQEALKRNIALNGLDNVNVINVALGDRKAEANIKGDDPSMYSLSETSASRIIAQTTMVMPGDLVIQEKKLPLPTVIKMDVEGYEYQIIKGLANTLKQMSCRFVFCEIHPALLPKESNPQVIINMLKDAGFSRIETHLRGEDIHVFCYKT